MKNYSCNYFCAYYVTFSITNFEIPRIWTVERWEDKEASDKSIEMLSIVNGSKIGRFTSGIPVII